MKKAYLIIRGLGCSLVGVEDIHLQYLDNILTYTPINVSYVDAFRQGQWDGKIHLFNKSNFPVGFVHIVYTYLKDKYDIEIRDTRSVGGEIKTSGLRIRLRDYQQEVVSNAILYQNASIELATGAGKTAVAAAFINHFKRRTVFIVPSGELLWQAAEMLSNYLGVNVGVVGDKESTIRDITVGTWQTLRKDQYIDYLRSVDTMIIDECQHVGANILKQISRACPAKYRLGMSGTLFREDGADLEMIGATGPRVAQISYSYLISRGWLVPARIMIKRVPPKPYEHYIDYRQVYQDYIINNSVRNKIIYDTVKELRGRKILIFTSRLPHGYVLKDLIGCDFVHSNHPNRRKIIERYRSGETQCLISTSLLQEGIDIPPIDALILAGPQKSLIATIQKIGRALRPFEGKKDCIIVDFMDNTKYLIEHFNRRLNYYRSEKGMSFEKGVVEPKSFFRE